MSLARLFKAGKRDHVVIVVASATIEIRHVQPSLTRRGSCCVDLIPALKGRAKFISTLRVEGSVVVESRVEMQG